MLINDQIRGLFYLYNTSGGSRTPSADWAAAAAWTPDSNTLYIVDSAALGGNHTNTLYVYNANTGWSTYDLTASGGAQNLAITVPGVGAYLSGNPPSLTPGAPRARSATTPPFSSIRRATPVNVLTSVLGATTDGEHILGASLNGASITLNDIGVSIPPHYLRYVLKPPPARLQSGANDSCAALHQSRRSTER